MFTSLTVTTPAADLSLLTVAERRAAAGLASGDTSQDADLLALDLRVAAAIASECNVAIGSGADPTLRRETLTEAFYRLYGVDALVLSRRHNITITSVVNDGETVDTGDYHVDPESGFLTGLSDDYPSRWRGSKITIVYAAGFATVPVDLKQAAIDCFRAFYLETSRDPLVKRTSVEIEDLETVTTDYWIGSVPGQVREGPVPVAVAGQLKRFRKVAVG